MISEIVVLFTCYLLGILPIAYMCGRPETHLAMATISLMNTYLSKQSRADSGTFKLLLGINTAAI